MVGAAGNKEKPINVSIICTHTSVGHADDMTGVAVLVTLFPEAEVIRSRKEEDWERADIVLDVGGQYDGEKWFDHHHWTYDGDEANARRRDNGIGYASAGLVWEKYGTQYCQAVADEHGLDAEQIARIVDDQYISIIDGIDTKTVISEHSVPGYDDTRLLVWQIAACLSSMNPVATIESDGPNDFDKHFLEMGVPLAKQLLDRAVLSAAGMMLVEKIVQDSDDGTPILKLQRFCRWDAEVVRNYPHVQFVVFQDVSGTWRVRTVPVEVNSKDARKNMPTSWRGKTGNELKAATGVDDIIFVHNGLFIAGTESRDGALALAQAALDA